MYPPPYMDVVCIPLPTWLWYVSPSLHGCGMYPPPYMAVVCIPLPTWLLPSLILISMYPPPYMAVVCIPLPTWLLPSLILISAHLINNCMSLMLYNGVEYCEMLSQSGKRQRC